MYGVGTNRKIGHDEISNGVVNVVPAYKKAAEQNSDLDNIQAVPQ